MTINYTELTQTLRALTDGESDLVSLMATVTCEVHHADDRFDWTGFYRVVAPELLKIGPYQGGMAVSSFRFPVVFAALLRPRLRRS